MATAPKTTKPAAEPEVEQEEAEEAATPETESAEAEEEEAEGEEEEDSAEEEEALDEVAEEEEEVDEELFAAQPVLPKGTYEMELVKCAARFANAEDREGSRVGVEYTFEPDRNEYPNAPQVRETVWARLYDDDKSTFQDMNRRAAIRFRAANLFPDRVVLTGLPGKQKRVKMEYDDLIGGMYKVALTEDEYPKGSGEKSNKIFAIKAL